MVLAKKQLSKVVAIVLVAMCAVAFMPMLNGEAFAAAKAKKPAKVTVQSATQVSKTTKVKVTWKKAKNAKTYNIKIDKKVVKKSYKKLTFTSAALKAGKHKVYVQAVNGKVKGAWSKAKAVTVKPLPAKVEIDGIAAVGETLKATVYDKSGKELTSGVTYQWYRTGANTGGDNPIAGATSAEYKVVAADVPYPLYVTAKAVGKEVKAAETAKVKYAQNITYFVALDGTAVRKGHTAPVVGDTLEIGVKFDGEIDPDDPYASYGTFDEYQWYADGVAINGATAPWYDVTKYEVGKVITVKMVKNHADGTSESFEAEASAKVVESTLPTAAKITGMTVETTYNADGSVKVAGTPAVGDTLKVEFTAPAGAVDDKATYQWTRGGSAISGATTATYTVKQADFGKALTCVVTNADGNIVTVEAIENVANNIGSAAVTVSPAAPALNTATTAAAKMGTTTLTADRDYVAAWYIDSVADENLITDSSNNAVKSLDATTQYYVNKKATALVGHKLIAVIEGKGTYVGTAQSAATPAMTATVTGVAIEADTTGTITAEQTTLTAKLTAPAEALAGTPDVKYQWSKSTDYDPETPAAATYTDISGATAATYSPTKAEALEEVKAFKVTVTGTDVYKFEGTNYATLPVTWGNGADATAVTFTVTNGTDGHDVATPAPGDVLTIKPTVAKAADTMTYTWKLMNGTTKVEEKTGASYTVPATAAKGNTVTVEAKTSGAYTLTQYAADITVQGTLKSVALVSKESVLTNNYMTTDRVAAPQVGDTLAADVEASDGTKSSGITRVTDGAKVTGDSVANDAVGAYQWYANGEAIEGATNSTYVIAAADLGKKISVKVTGAAGYLGSELTSAESGTVIAYGNIVLKDADGNVVPKDAQLSTYVRYQVSVDVAGVDATFTAVCGDEAVSVDADGYFVLTDRNVGKTLTIKASADGLAEATAGDLTWSTDLEIVEGSVDEP